MKAFVLSGGAGFGAYQVGAWRALLESGWRPNVVLGTSIGAVNAFLIAHGASGREMHEAWVETPAGLGAVNGRRTLLPFARDVGRFRAWTAEMVRQFGARPFEYRLQIHMAAVSNGAMRAVEGGAVSERHLLAACALPPVMAPVRVDGRLYVDGGVLYPVALKEAVATGASDIIVVDVLRSTPSQAVRMFRLTVLHIRNWLRQESHQPAREDLARVRVRCLGPSSPLGTIRECFKWDRARAERMIALGYRETMEVLEREVGERGNSSSVGS